MRDSEAVLAEAMQHLQRGDLEAAAAVLQQPARQGHPRALELLAGIALQRSDASAARSLYQRLLKIDTENTAALAGMGECLRRQGQFTQAEQHLRRALALNPQLSGAAYNLALTQDQRPEQAELAYEKTLRINPKHVKANNNLANLLKRRGEFEQAMSHYQQALAHNPNSLALHFNLGNTWRELGQPERARDAYAAAMALAAPAPGLLNNRVKRVGSI